MRFARLSSLALCTLVLCASTVVPAATAEPPKPVPPRVETLATGLNLPWSMAFLPDRSLLIVEKAGGVRRFANGELSAPLKGVPTGVMVAADSGLHDIVLDPDFATNQRVFLAYASGDEKANHLAVWRARLDGKRLVGGKVIFRTTPDKTAPKHPGGRIAFLPDRTFLLTVGDGYLFKEQAQDLNSYLGKILRLDRDGKAPADNPFVGRNDARPEIYTLGHRNPQGLTVDAHTGQAWENEHGARGGDEINRLESGKNYGWPRTTSGVDYDGTLISEHAHAPDVTSPLIVWAPSIAPSGLAVYRGARFAAWNGKFLVGALANESVVIAALDNDGRSIEELQRLPQGARIRDVRVGPDGLVYLLTDETEGRLLRLQPAG